MTSPTSHNGSSGTSPPIAVDENGIPKTFPDGSPYRLDKPLPPPVPVRKRRRRRPRWWA